MTKTVQVNLATKPQEFPLDTVEGLFRFELIRASDNFLFSFVETASTGAIFPLVEEGVNLIARVTKNGVSAELAFNLPKTIASFQVPDVVTLTIS